VFTLGFGTVCRFFEGFVKDPKPKVMCFFGVDFVWMDEKGQINGW
jgi:hypothetical protein